MCESKSILIIELVCPSTKNASACYIQKFLFIWVTLWNLDIDIFCTCILLCMCTVYTCMSTACAFISVLGCHDRDHRYTAKFLNSLNSLVCAEFEACKMSRDAHPSPSSNMRAKQKWLWQDELDLKPTDIHWKLLYQEKLESERARNHFESQSILALKSNLTYTISTPDCLSLGFGHQMAGA